MYFLYKEINVKKNKLVTALLFCAVMFFVVSPLAAQSSNTAKSTAGVFGNDIDNFMSTTEYGRVEFDKGFIFLGLDSNTNLDLGYATRLGSFYLGTWYEGSILDGSSTDTITIETEPNVIDFVVIDESKTTTQTLNDTTNTKNKGAVLFGIANMGFKLGVEQNATVKKTTVSPILKEEYIASTGTYTKTEYTDTDFYSGKVKPYLDFGMNLDLGSMLLKPRAGFGVEFYSFKTGDTKNVTVSTKGSKLNLDQNTQIYSYNDSYIGLNPSLGASLVFAKDNGSELVLDAGYRLELPLYNSTYTDASGSEQKIKGSASATRTITTKETLNSTSTTINWSASTTEKSFMENNFNLGASYTLNPAERLSLGFGGGLDVSLENEKTIKTTYNTTKIVVDSKSQNPTGSSVTTTEIVTPGNTTEVATLGLTPTARLGMQYQIVPQKFILNSGVKVSLPSFSRTQTTTTRTDPEVTRIKRVNGNGTITIDTVDVTELDREESQKLSTLWSPTGLSLSTGFTWNVTDKAALDVGLHSGVGMKTVALWDLMTTKMDLKFTVKY